MPTRTIAVRLMALAIVATLGSSLWATCAEGAMSTEHEQMACCKHGHHTCGPHGTPAQCCQTAQHASQFTTVGKITAPMPSLVLAQMFGSTVTTFQAPWHPTPLTDTWSPPGTKHPTYLLLSTLRI